MKSSIEDISRIQGAALRLLNRDNGFRAKALRDQIEAINPAEATRRELVRLQSLCRKVATHYGVDLREAATIH